MLPDFISSHTEMVSKTMIKQELNDANISPAVIERHANDIREMKESQAILQAEFDNSIRKLNKTINATEQLQAEFEIKKKKYMKCKERIEEDGAIIAEEKEWWNSVLTNGANISDITVLGDVEEMNEHKAFIQLAKKKLEDLAVAEQRWQAAKETWTEDESRLAECTKSLATLKCQIERETEDVTHWTECKVDFQKEIDDACILLIWM